MNWDTAKNVSYHTRDYHQLCHLSHHYVQDTSAPLYVGYYRSRPHLHDPLHADQFQVENQHTRGKQRHDGRRIIILQLYIQFQSCMVALFFHFAIRDAWHSPYHCKTAYLIRSFSRIYCRIVLWCHWNFVYLKKISINLIN